MILSGKEVAASVYSELSKKIVSFSTPPGLAVIMVGDLHSSKTYVNMKIKTCEKMGIRSFLYHLPESTTQVELIELIESLNNRKDVDGILVQLPLPKQIDSIHIIQTISPSKDVDGLHPLNVGKLLMGVDDGFVPCTPLGIHTLLKFYSIPLVGKNVVIIGRSNIVGKPLAALLLQNNNYCNATVTVAHSRSKNIENLTCQADIVVAALGVPRFIKADMIRDEAVVIDVGINRENGQIVGDVDFENVEKKCFAITPVPGGIGPMTVAMLLQNTVLSHQRTLTPHNP